MNRKETKRYEQVPYNRINTLYSILPQIARNQHEKVRTETQNNPEKETKERRINDMNDQEKLERELKRMLVSVGFATDSPTDEFIDRMMKTVSDNDHNRISMAAARILEMSKPVWKYPSKGEWPQTDGAIWLVYGRRTSFYSEVDRPFIASCNTTTRQWWMNGAEIIHVACYCAAPTPPTERSAGDV